MRCCQRAAIIAAVVAAVSPLAVGPAGAGRSSTGLSPQNAAALIRANAGNTEVVTFGNRRLPPVTIFRGKSRRPVKPGTITIANLAVRRVLPKGRAGTEMLVAFADPRLQPVTVLRGGGFEPPDLELFAPAATL